MNKTILEEILELKKSFETGIYFYEYMSKKKLLRVKIDYAVEVRLDKATQLLVREIISKEEYNDYKQRIEQTRQKYKQLLSTV